MRRSNGRQGVPGNWWQNFLCGDVSLYTHSFALVSTYLFHQSMKRPVNQTAETETMKKPHDR